MPAVKRERGFDSDVEGYEDPNEEEDHEERRTTGAGAGPSGAGLYPRPRPFARGAVKLVKVHDFMTYSGTVTIRPGPRLNLILGPNGTGKSSLVCALCIGLNGSPKTLGRADNLADFVRRGQHSCWTEITLSSGGEARDQVVRRTISRRTETDSEGRVTTHYSSKWAINGRDVTSKDVDALIKQLNIQFDNLCQFLPQDRVSEFARMNQYELLAATEKALGDSSLYDQHQQLIALRKEEKIAAGDLESSSKRLEKLQSEQERQRRDYERFQQRESLMEEARAYRCQAKWLEVHAKKEAAQAAGERVRERKEELAELQGKQQQDMRPITAREELVKDLKQQRHAAERVARDADRHTVRQYEKLQKNEQDTNRLADELGALEAQSRKRLEDIGVAREKLRRAREELQQAPERLPEDQVARISTLRTEVLTSRQESNEVQAERNNLASQVQGLQAEIGRVRGHIDHLASRKYQLLQRLGATYRNIGALHGWIEQHRADGTFQGPVFGPIALELTVNAAPGVPAAAAAQYVESTCWQWLGSYVVTCPADEARLSEEAKTLGVTGVRIANCAHNPEEQFVVDHPCGPASQHARYGITHTVDELISAPPIIMFALAGQCKIGQAYIGTNQAIACMDALARDTPISTVLVGGSRHSVLRSRYAAGQRSIEEKELFPTRLLGGGAAGGEEEARLAELQGRERQLAQERDSLQAQSDELGRRMQSLEQQRNAWDAEAQELYNQQTAITQRRTALRAAAETAERNLRNREAVPDPEARRPALRRSLEERLDQHAGLVRQMLTAMQAGWAATQEAQLLELRINEAVAQVAALRAGAEARAVALQAARNAVADTQRAYDAAREQYRLAKEAAEESYPKKESDELEVKRHIEQKTSRSALLEAAEKKEAEAEAVVCCNENVVREFQRRQADIEALAGTVQAQQAEAQRLRDRITEVKGLWLPDISAMVDTINESFSTNFREIGCAGEVRLHEDEDFEKYAVQIMVQFRAQEEMQLLNSHRQSGGERSVSTILYLIALQNVTETPFRVVDEINQGMDAINERKVFQQLVTASTAEDTPQCFLLTPKLLPDLNYSRDITVLAIQNGGNVDPAAPAAMACTVAGMLGKRVPRQARVA